MSLPPGYALQETPPSPERREAGLSPRTVEGARRGLPSALAAASVTHEGEVVAMGRLVGDDAMNFGIVDIAVAPAHQRRGLGRTIMARLMAHVEAMATPGAPISVIADRGAEPLHAGSGFKPCLPDAQGTALFMPLAQS